MFKFARPSTVKVSLEAHHVEQLESLTRFMQGEEEGVERSDTAAHAVKYFLERALPVTPRSKLVPVSLELPDDLLEALEARLKEYQEAHPEVTMQDVWRELLSVFFSGRTRLLRAWRADSVQSRATRDSSDVPVSPAPSPHTAQESIKTPSSQAPPLHASAPPGEGAAQAARASSTVDSAQSIIERIRARQQASSREEVSSLEIERPMSQTPDDQQG